MRERFLEEKQRYNVMCRLKPTKTDSNSRIYLQNELTLQRLCESADLYAEAYEKDDETQEWTDVALSGWPSESGGN